MKRTISLLILLAVVLASNAAPAPFPKKHKLTNVSSLHGKWEGKWGGSPQVIWLYPGGGYNGVYCNSSSKHGGWWKYVDGVLVISESTTPENPASHTLYKIQINAWERGVRFSGDVAWEISGSKNANKTTVEFHKRE